MTGHLDLGYWEVRDYWFEGWRPDGFFSLPKAKQDEISRQVEAAHGDWPLAKQLTSRALKRVEGSGW
jgi:hypothetical protein